MISLEDLDFDLESVFEPRSIEANKNIPKFYFNLLKKYLNEAKKENSQKIIKEFQLYSDRKFVP